MNVFINHWPCAFLNIILIKALFMVCFILIRNKIWWSPIIFNILSNFFITKTCLSFNQITILIICFDFRKLIFDFETKLRYFWHYLPLLIIFQRFNSIWTVFLLQRNRFRTLIGSEILAIFLFDLCRFLWYKVKIYFFTDMFLFNEIAACVKIQELFFCLFVIVSFFHT